MILISWNDRDLHSNQVILLPFPPSLQLFPYLGTSLLAVSNYQCLLSEVFLYSPNTNLSFTASSMQESYDSLYFIYLLNAEDLTSSSQIHIDLVSFQRPTLSKPKENKSALPFQTVPHIQWMLAVFSFPCSSYFVSSLFQVILSRLVVNRLGARKHFHLTCLDQLQRLIRTRTYQFWNFHLILECRFNCESYKLNWHALHDFGISSSSFTVSFENMWENNEFFMFAEWEMAIVWQNIGSLGV